jgi:LEA14-like dessication related protein
MALLALALVLASCSGIEEPNVVMTGVDIKGISTDGIELDLLVEVENPNDFGADIGDLTYNIYLDGLKVATGLQEEAVSVPAGSTVEVGVPFTIVWKGLDKGLRKLLDGEEHDWRIKGRVELSKGPLSKSFSFSETGEFTAPKASDIEIDLDL